MDVKVNKPGKQQREFETREINFTILLSEREFSLIKSKAMELGVSKSELARQLMFPVIGERRRIL